MPTRSKKKQSDEVFSITLHNRDAVIIIIKVPVTRPKRSTRAASKKTTEDDSLSTEISHEE